MILRYGYLRRNRSLPQILSRESLILSPSRSSCTSDTFLRFFQRVPIPPVSSLVRTLASAFPPFPLDTNVAIRCHGKERLRNCILSAGCSIVKVHWRKISPHPVFHTFFAIYQVEPLEFTKNSQIQFSDRNFSCGTRKNSSPCIGYFFSKSQPKK